MELVVEQVEAVEEMLGQINWRESSWCRRSIHLERRIGLPLSQELEEQVEIGRRMVQVGQNRLAKMRVLEVKGEMVLLLALLQVLRWMIQIHP